MFGEIRPAFVWMNSADVRVGVPSRVQAGGPAGKGPLPAGVDHDVAF